MNRKQTRTKRLSCAIAAASVVIALSGCGNEPTIEQADADAAIAALEGVEMAYADGRCGVATQRAQSLATQIDDLPAGTDRELRRALQRSTDRLETLVASQCDEPEPTEPTEPVSDVAPPEPEKPDKNKDKQKDKGNDQGEGNGPPPEDVPPEEQPPPGDEDSGGVAPGEDGVLE